MGRVGSYPTFSPSPVRDRQNISVALVLRLPSAGVTRYPCPVEPGLSSSGAFRPPSAAVRPGRGSIVPHNGEIVKHLANSFLRRYTIAIWTAENNVIASQCAHWRGNPFSQYCVLSIIWLLTGLFGGIGFPRSLCYLGKTYNFRHTVSIMERGMDYAQQI